MAEIDFARLVEPVAPEAPCGPDLDLEGDPDFMNFLARLDGALPQSFWGTEQEGRLFHFDRSTIRFADEVGRIAAFLETTRDLRLLVLAAKLAILDRNLEGFAEALDGIGALLRERWDEVHPRVEGGDASFRNAAVQALDDLPQVVLPLQFLPLVQSKRFGAISLRSHQIATGEVQPREGEEKPDTAALDKAFEDADLEALVAVRDRVHRIQRALAFLRERSVESVGYEQAISFDTLPGTVDQILAMLDARVRARDPSRALAPPAPDRSGAEEGLEGEETAVASSIPQGSVRTRADAAAALAAAAAYFAAVEPSSPAILLVRQAERLIGKSFFEAVTELVPDYASQATIQVGGDHLFALPVERLAGATGEAATDGSWGYDADAEEGSGGEAAVEESEEAAADSPAAFNAASRADALALIGQAGAFFRAAEPASPIPLFTDRARALAGRDFLSLLKDVLPEGSLTIASPP